MATSEPKDVCIWLLYRSGIINDRVEVLTHEKLQNRGSRKHDEVSGCLEEEKSDEWIKQGVAMKTKKEKKEEKRAKVRRITGSCYSK